MLAVMCSDLFWIGLCGGDLIARGRVDYVMEVFDEEENSVYGLVLRVSLYINIFPFFPVHGSCCMH